MSVWIRSSFHLPLLSLYTLGLPHLLPYILITVFTYLSFWMCDELVNRFGAGSLEINPVLTYLDVLCVSFYLYFLWLFCQRESGQCRPLRLKHGASWRLRSAYRSWVLSRLQHSHLVLSQCPSRRHQCSTSCSPVPCWVSYVFTTAFRTLRHAFFVLFCPRYTKLLD